MQSGGGAAPTGCYKCGRPGHWSRDCPSNPNPNPSTNENDNPPLSNSTNSTSYGPRPPNLAPIQKPKLKAPRRSRPKLTPEILLSDAGLGHILRYFPRALKCRGRGHEVDDLEHLLGMYAEWHSRLLPYYNFNQFIHKVEQVGSTKHVKVCLRELRDKIANGADPTKLHEKQVQQTTTSEQDAQGAMEMPSNSQDNALQNEDNSNYQEDMPQAAWENATEEMSQPSHVKNVYSVDITGGEEAAADKNTAVSSQSQITEEQRARMEANKQRALERAAARRSLCT